jgi:hypothetical protein
MADTKERFASLAEYIERKRAKKYAVAEDLGISRYQMSALLYPGRYSVRVDDNLAVRIARLLNQPVSHVKKLYDRAA